MTIISPDAAEKLNSSVNHWQAQSSTAHYSDQSEQAPTSRGSDFGSDEPPPYSISTESSLTATSRRDSTNESTYQLPNISPTNHLELKRPNHSIRETLVIDPAIQVPAALVQGSSARKNVYLESANGSVNADIYLVEPHFGSRPRATLGLRSKNGGVTGKIFRADSKGSPFRIEASSDNGSVRVYLPRDFSGPIITTTRNGSVKLSEAMKAQAMNFGDVRTGGQMRFIGDYSAYRDAESWTRDEADIRSNNGSLSLYYNDEQPEPNPVRSFCSSWIS